MSRPTNQATVADTFAATVEVSITIMAVVAVKVAAMRATTIYRFGHSHGNGRGCGKYDGFHDCSHG